MGQRHSAWSVLDAPAADSHPLSPCHASRANMRRTPGYLGKPNSDRIGLVPGGQQLTIVDGPNQKDNLVWWQVQWRDKTGWMAERTASGVLILKLSK